MNENSEKKILRIAVQKSGRLGRESMDLLKKSGFKIYTHDRTLLARASNFPLEILFLRVGDIPQIVADGLADLGIVGENSLAEAGNTNIEIIESLGFGECTLCVAAPENGKIQKFSDCQRKIIATSYPNILKKFFAEKNISAEVVHMSGSHEIAPQLGLADAICDIVSTGGTLRANKLTNLGEIFESQAVLIAKTGTEKILEEKNISDFLIRLHSVLTAKNLKSVVLNLPESSLSQIVKILPSLESPTVMPLAKKGWVAIHSVVQEDEKFWEKISDLKKIGATGILISSIERVIA